MQVTKTRCEITSGKPDKENVDDGGVLTYEFGAEFAVPRQAIDEILPVKGFTDQFYNGEDTRLECLYPLNFNKKLEELRVTVHVGSKPMVFDGSTIRPNVKLTPLVGQYVQVVCKIKVYPTREQAGRLDQAVKEFIDLEVAEMTADFAKAANG